MQNFAAKKHYTLEEYAELEKSSEERLEYFEGNVWSMAGASANHETIVSNLIYILKSGTGDRKCRVFGSNLRIKVPVYKPYRYPDVSALCAQPIFEEFYGLQMLVNPALIVEVLSDSTKTFDLHEKFTYYKSIESFTEYLLIDQDRPQVILYTRRDEKVWLHQEFNSLNETVFLTSLDCGISLAELYTDVEFKKTDWPRFPFDIENYR